MNQLKKILDRFYRESDFRERMKYDPVEFPHRYNNPSDIEVSGFIASCFAYGRVDLFKPVIENILSKMGASPYEFLSDFKLKKHRKLFDGIKYRFNDNDDIVCLLFLLHNILSKKSSVLSVFKSFYKTDHTNIGNSLVGLVNSLLEIDTSKVYGSNLKPSGLLQFLPSPASGSACKRSNLFLRWMIRDRDIDFGIWSGIPKNRLIIPLDTHIARISRCLGFTERKSNDWKTALEITNSLKKFDPEDPLKYDFALCHHGISGICQGRKEKSGCIGCVFRTF